MCTSRYLIKLVEANIETLNRLIIYNKEDMQNLILELPEVPNLSELIFSGETLTLNWNQSLSRLTAVATNVNFKNLQPQLNSRIVSVSGFNYNQEELQ